MFLYLCDLGSTLITVFDQVGNIPCPTYEEDFAVHICHRHSHYPQLHVRKARYGWSHALCDLSLLHWDSHLPKTLSTTNAK